MPSTAAGKEVSKYNATKHGLTGKQIVIKGEDPADYDAFRASLYAEYEPQSEEESMLVERIAQNWWKLQRAERVEPAFHSEPDHQLNPQFYRFQRYKRTIERSWEAARKELMALQRERFEIDAQMRAEEARRREAAAARARCTASADSLNPFLRMKKFVSAPVYASLATPPPAAPASAPSPGC